MANNSNTVNRNAGIPGESQRDPSKPYHQIVPRSMRDSGTNLDECCGRDIQQASGGLGLDKALNQKMTPSVGTVFNDAEQTTQIGQIPVPGKIGLSPTMQKLIKNTAPRNAYIVEEK